jgi:hypothetical protein
MEREELHRRILLLKEYLDTGKLRLMASVSDSIGASLLKVRIADDGLVEPGTVDARIRALLLLVAGIHDREQAKTAMSLREIQEAFYANIESVFGALYESMLRHSATPDAVAAGFASSAERVRSTDSDVIELLSATREFWQQTSFSAWTHCEDARQLKGVFGGSLFPESNASIVSSCGLYLDTICLPDPLLRISTIAKLWKPEERVREVVRFGLGLLQYREAVLAEVDPPIAVILPDLHEFDESYRKTLASISENNILKHSAALFGRDFTSVAELRAFTDRFESSDTLVKALAEPKRLLFDSDDNSPLTAQIDTFMANEGHVLRLKRAGEVVYANTLGRMQQANDALYRSRRVRGVPILDAETSWRYFNWKLEDDAQQDEVLNRPPFHIVRGLQHVARGEMEWLGRIPIDGLVEIRRRGALDEIRAILARGIGEIDSADPASFLETSNQVALNIQQAFEKHRENIEELRKKKWTFAGRDIGSWIAVGTLEIAAAIMDSPVLGVGAIAAHQLLDAPKLRDLPAKVRKLKDESAELRSSATGLLFKHRIPGH